MIGMKAALNTVKTIQNFQPRFWIPMGVISTMIKLVSLCMFSNAFDHECHECCYLTS